jgi:myo-inositol-1(or 4)-monophosphatase
MSSLEDIFVDTNKLTPDMNSLDTLLSKTINITKKAAELIENERQNFDFSKIEYKGQNDLVSFVDKQSELFLVDYLGRLLPEAGFIAEEGTGEAKKINWVIDPLDGTTNFMHGLSPYSISIGLMDGEELILGVIFEITSQTTYYAHKDGKAFCNGEVIRVSGIKNFSDGLYITGYPYRDFSKFENFNKIMYHFLANSHGVRRFGSAAADLAYVACGKSEGFFEFFLNPWDVAAGALIVQRAGGMVTDFRGGNNFIYGKELIAGTFVQPEMQKIIESYWYG